MNLHLTCTILKVGITLALDGYHVAVFWYTAFKPEGRSMTTTKRVGMLRVKNVHVEVDGGQKRAKLCSRSH